MGSGGTVFGLARACATAGIRSFSEALAQEAGLPACAMAARRQAGADITLCQLTNSLCGTYEFIGRGAADGGSPTDHNPIVLLRERGCFWKSSYYPRQGTAICLLISQRQPWHFPKLRIGR